MQQYALVDNNQITRTELFKRPNLVPAGDWRVIGEVTPDYDAATHQLGGKTLQILADGSVAYVWSVVEIPPPPVPSEIQMWQARAMLIRMNMLASVNAAVAASGNAEIQNAWEYAPNVVRRSAFVNAMAGALGLTDEQIDNLFIEGAKIR
ncbi:MAG: hypothetical protein ACK5X3_11705 [Pseudomonadota bacterium]